MSLISKENKGRMATAMRNKYGRIVLLIDMDCFYCQVEEKINPKLKGCPLAVVQHNAWRGGGIIAVNYAARAQGVTRHMRGDEAKAQCADIELVQVPKVREKADLSKYRDAGNDVANVLQQFTTILERASVDEAYLDITHLVNERLNNMYSGNFVLKPQELLNTYAVGYENIGLYVSEITTRFTDHNCHNAIDHNNKLQQNNATDNSSVVQQLDIRLLIGASISNEIRAAVKAQTAFECSAGISYNKILAKLACGMNKPNKQTILPLSQIPQLFDTLPLSKIKGMGGKFGEEVCERTNVKFIGQLRNYTEEQLQKKFDEKNGTWLYYICRGIDFQAVTPRFYSKSIGCCKRFPGQNCITGLETLQHWLQELASEISKRLEKDMIDNNRRAKQMVVSFTQEFDGGEDVPSSRSMAINSYDLAYLVRNSLEIIKTNTELFLSTKNNKKLNNAIKFLGISVGKFETISKSHYSLQEMFAQQTAKKCMDNQNGEIKNQVESVEKTLIKSKTNDANKNTNEQLEKDFFSNGLQKIDNTNSTTSKTISTSSSSTSQPVANSIQIPEIVDSNQKHNENEKSAVATKTIKSFFLESLSKQIAKPKQLVKKVENAKRRANEINSESSQEKRRKYTENKINEDNDEMEDYILDDADDDLEEDKDASNSDNKNNKENTENNNDYIAEYAELAVPELPLSCKKFIICDECYKEISADERSVQLHRDYHYALKVSKQLRLEYQENNNNQLNTLISSHSKKTTKSISKNNKYNISKFFKPKNLKNSTSTETSTKICDNFELCTKCDKLIVKSDLNEHLDFHMAMELQNEVNTVNIANNKNHNSTTSINKEPKLNTNNNKKTAKESSIINYFLAKS